ncbi:MAG: hypothetical protein WCF36_01375 [Candidatus Nanopelagicales bacterium]
MHNDDHLTTRPAPGPDTVDLREHPDTPAPDSSGQPDRADSSARPDRAGRVGGSVPDDPDRDVSAGVAGLPVSVRALVAEGVLPVGLDTGERPVADVRALLRALTQVEAVLGLRMAAAEGLVKLSV